MTDQTLCGLYGGCQKPDICHATSTCVGLAELAVQSMPGPQAEPMLHERKMPLRDLAEIDRAKAAEFFRKQKVIL